MQINHPHFPLFQTKTMSDLDTTKNELNGDEIKMEIQIPSKEEQTENSGIFENAFFKINIQKKNRGHF